MWKILTLSLCGFFLLSGCSRLADVLSYEASINRKTIESNVLPEYSVSVLADATLENRLVDAGFTSFLWLGPDATVTAWYRDGVDQETTHNIKSVSKALFTSLLGQSEAMDLADVNATIASISKCRVPDALAPLTFEILLNMTAGFDFVENASTAIYAGPEWGCRALELPVSFPSGTRFNYNTLQYHLAGLALAEQRGQDIAALLQRFVLGPMGVTLDGWVVTPDNDTFVGSEMRLHPLDMLRFGHVFLQNGRWTETQIIPEAWVARTRLPHQRDTGRDGITYGWGWWQTRLSGFGVQFAEGYGGQAIVVVPGAQQVFTFTAPTGGLVSGRQHDARIEALLGIVAEVLARPAAQ